MGNYTIFCVHCKRTYSQDYILTCQVDDSLLRARYETQRLTVREGLPGLWKFHDWLPTRHRLNIGDAPIAYRADELAREVNLGNLWVCFNGYWPERGARILTCSFKELAAPVSIERAIESGERALMVSSAGSYARGFAYTATLTGFPCIIMVPEQVLGNIWSPVEPGANVKFIAVRSHYTSTTRLSRKISNMVGILHEGGPRNIAHRDALAVDILASTVVAGRLPAHYIQSVSSGAGAIASWEASLRLIEDGRFGDRLPKLHLVQNDPFTPIVNAWRAKRRQIIPECDMPNADERIDKISAPELSNQEPVYSSAGGVYDALVDTGGGMYAVTNNEIAEAKKLFEEVEGIDILPAAAASLAALIKISREGKITDSGEILLNITGGGMKRLREDREVYPIKPWLTIKGEEDIDHAVKEVKSEFGEVAGRYEPT